MKDKLSALILSFFFVTCTSTEAISTEIKNNGKNSDNPMIHSNPSDYEGTQFDWSMFQHDAARTGHIEGKGLISIPIEKWKFQTKITDDIETYLAVGDTDGDGDMEIVFGISKFNRTYVIDGETGRLEWLHDFQNNCSTIGWPSIVDIDNDGQNEVLVLSSGATFDNYSHIYALDGMNGQVKWRHDVLGYIDAAPIAYDVDSDGSTEVVVPTTNTLEVLFGKNGSIKASYKIAGTDYKAVPAIGDIDNDGNAEIVISAGQIYAIDGKKGTIDWISNETGKLALGDLDGDHNIEVVVNSIMNGIVVLNGTNGIRKWSILPANETNKGNSWLAIGDLNNNGYSDVIFVRSSGMYAIDGYSRKIIWSRSDNSYNPSPAIGDIDGDGEIEVLIQEYLVFQYSRISSLNGITGDVEWSFINKYPHVLRGFSVTIADIDRDGYLEVVAGFSDRILYAIDGLPSLKVDITAKPHLGDAPLNVLFNSSVSGGEPPYTYFWEFGDGSTSAQSNPSHVYTDPGTYNVSLKITDSLSNNVSTQVIIIVNSPQQPVTNLTLTILIIVPVAILILLVFLILFLRRRRTNRETASSRDTPKQIDGNKK